MKNKRALETNTFVLAVSREKLLPAMVAYLGQRRVPYMTAVRAAEIAVQEKKDHVVYLSEAHMADYVRRATRAIDRASA